MMHVILSARLRIMAAFAAIIALAAVLLVVVVPGASATYPGDEGRIAFHRPNSTSILPDGTMAVEIGTVNPDGTGVSMLVVGSNAKQPVWSPDGTQIAYLQSETATGWQLYVMNADGSGQRQVSNMECCTSPNYPSWSADGSTVIMQHESGILAVDMSTGQHRTLVAAQSNALLFPQFAPDGSALAWLQYDFVFVNNAGYSEYKLIKANPDGSNPTVISEISAPASDLTANYLEWYPHSREIGWGYVLAAKKGNDRHHVRITTAGDVVSDIVNNDINRILPSPTGDRIIVEARNINGNSRPDNYFATLDLQISAAVMPAPSTIRMSSWQATSAANPPGDLSAPTVAIASPLEGGEAVLGSDLVADYSCTDESGGSGLASCVGNVDDGASLDTSAVGNKTFTVTARDNAGNQTVKTVKYRVIWPFSDFLGPVDPLPTLNTSKAGGVIPVTFSLGGDRGLGILATGYPKSSKVTCNNSAPKDAIEATVLSPGVDVLSYNADTQQYEYNWKTDAAWRGTCRQLTFMLSDGATYHAHFKFS